MRSRLAGQCSSAVIKSRIQASEASHRTQRLASCNSKTLSIVTLVPGQVLFRFCQVGWASIGRGDSLRFGPERRTGMFFQHKKPTVGLRNREEAGNADWVLARRIPSYGPLSIHQFNLYPSPTRNLIQRRPLMPQVACSKLPEMTIRCATFETRRIEADRGRW
ncbi:MAG: hypothetical protein CL912_06995 [Deltaproteobacteria bacterium]|nr:hypothetical protein [Deltaproteobacteria bacterium]